MRRIRLVGYKVSAMHDRLELVFFCPPDADELSGEDEVILGGFLVIVIPSDSSLLEGDVGSGSLLADNEVLDDPSFIFVRFHRL